jgi:hypothetical protein
MSDIRDNLLDSLLNQANDLSRTWRGDLQGMAILHFR